MTGPLNPPAALALDAALISLTAYHVVEWLVREPAHGGRPVDVARATGIPLREVLACVEALASRHVLATDGEHVTLAPAQAPALVAAWRRLEVDATLRRKALAVAADREARTVTIRVTWAPMPDAGPVAPAPAPLAGPAAPAS